MELSPNSEMLLGGDNWVLEATPRAVVEADADEETTKEVVDGTKVAAATAKYPIFIFWIIL